MFGRVEDLPLLKWEPTDPNGTHLWLIAQFNAAGHTFGPYTVTNNVKGNVGEAIVHVLGMSADFAGCRCEMANAQDPFSAISRPGVDLLWIDDSDATQLRVCVQEVKTSGDPDLAIAGGLVEDYKKLFEIDPRLTLTDAIERRCIPDPAPRAR